MGSDHSPIANFRAAQERTLKSDPYVIANNNRAWEIQLLARGIDDGVMIRIANKHLT